MEDTQIPAAIDGIDALFDAWSSLKDSVVSSESDKSSSSDESPKKKRLCLSHDSSDDEEGSARDNDNFTRFRKTVKEVLHYYNSNHKDANYECVAIVAQCPYKGRGRWGYGAHMNFFARQKGSDSSPVLFYADRFGHPSDPEIECCILNPSPISFDEYVPGVAPSASVYHPPNVKCADCEAMAEALAMFESDSDCDNSIDMF